MPQPRIILFAMVFVSKIASIPTDFGKDSISYCIRFYNYNTLELP